MSKSVTWLRNAFLLAAVPVSVGFLVNQEASARSIRGGRGFPSSAPMFGLEDRPVVTTTPAKAIPGHATSNAIAALKGGGNLVIDEDSGYLMRTDRTGKLVHKLEIGSGAAQLTYDEVSNTVFVADRNRDRIVAIAVSDTGLTQTKTIATDTDPYGVALSPDRSTLLVTAVADRTLTAFDPVSGKSRWRKNIAAEPRGVAISADGKRAAIAHLGTGTVDYIGLGAETAQVQHVALAANRSINQFGRDQARGFARNSFAVQFLGDELAIVPFQRSVPVQEIVGENTGSYGGGFEPPITQHLAFVGFGGDRIQQTTAQVANHQVRAMAWDAKTDTLYLAGLGNDTVVAINNATKDSIVGNRQMSVLNGQERCGPTGLAVNEDGSVSVWCSFTRSVANLYTPKTNGQIANNTKVTAYGPSLIASKMSKAQHEGFVAFHSSDFRTSTGGAMACSSCHPEGRADGLTWRIEKNELQTPVLSGRVAGTHPYKWDGGDKDLQTSLISTVRRLGGSGINTEAAKSLAAYVESIPKPRAPKRDGDLVARGKKLFENEAVGCASCHNGKLYTDNETHNLEGTLTNVDTPSLVGLASSAPYYHDGSAATLQAMLRNHGAVYGMADTEKLTAAQIAELTAFLETL